ncbi:MAG: hypothetical protein ABL949_14830, partial [Fimbriimonadaceae bacterium]
AVSFQYELESFTSGAPKIDLTPRWPEAYIDFEFLAAYGFLYLFVGAGIGLVCGGFFSQHPRRWFVWVVSWALTLAAVWFAPLINLNANPFELSTYAAWSGTLAFCLFHLIWYGLGEY